MKKNGKIPADKSRNEKPVVDKDVRNGTAKYRDTLETSRHINKKLNKKPELEEEDDELVENYDSGYENDEGYDNYEVRSSRVDFDHDYDETRGEFHSPEREKRSKTKEKDKGQGRSQKPENKSDRDFDEIEKSWEHSSNAEDESRLDLYGSEPIGRNIRDRYTADIGEGPRAKRRSGTSNSDEEELPEKNDKKVKGSETSRREALFAGVKSKGVRNKSVTKGGKSTKKLKS